MTCSKMDKMKCIVCRWVHKTQGTTRKTRARKQKMIHGQLVTPLRPLPSVTFLVSLAAWLTPPFTAFNHKHRKVRLSTEEKKEEKKKKVSTASFGYVSVQTSTDSLPSVGFLLPLGAWLLPLRLLSINRWKVQMSTGKFRYRICHLDTVLFKTSTEVYKF